MRNPVHTAHLDANLRNACCLQAHTQRLNNKVVFTFVEDACPFTLNSHVGCPGGCMDAHLIPQV